MNEEKDIKWERIKYIITIVSILFIFSTIMLLLYLKADEVTKSPCEVCAKRLGKDVQCTEYGIHLKPNQRIYYPNGSYQDVD